MMLMLPVKVDDHIETLRLKSSRFANWIARLYYKHTKNVLGIETTQECQDSFGIACHIRW